MTLEGENALRRAKAAERAVRRDVRSYRTGTNANMRAKVWTSSVNRSARQHHRRKRAIGATINDEFDVHGEQFAVSRHGCFVSRSRGMALRRRHHVFRAVVDDL